jgi:hypothetical protein
VWLLRAPDTLPTTGWSCSVTLRMAPGSAGGQTTADSDAQTVAAAPSGSDFKVTIDASTSASLGDGQLRWVAMATKAGETYCIGRGTIVLEPLDGVTQNERTLAAIDAVLAGRGGADLDEYTIGDRHIRKIPLGELVKLRGVYARRVARERRGHSVAHYGAEAVPRGYPTLAERRGYGTAW